MSQTGQRLQDEVSCFKLVYLRNIRTRKKGEQRTPRNLTWRDVAGLTPPSSRGGGHRRASLEVRHRTTRRRQDPAAATVTLALRPAVARGPARRRVPRLQGHAAHAAAHR